LLHPDAGRVLVEGENVTEMAERELRAIRRKIGMLFQAGALFDSLTAGENIAFPLREHHPDWDLARIQDRVTEVLGLVELPGVEGKMPDELSGGMRKRVALARSIAVQPRGILYDEPTTGLDPVTARTINVLIRNLQERLGVTSIVVTHDIDSAFYVADRIAFLHEGRMQFIGTPAEARESADPYLKAFLNARMGGPR
jgi:phospholipid/cholesterol/gamma-HCH transport system ATP-binding protein